MANSPEHLRAGFTGTPKEKPTGIAGKAQQAATAVRDEANAVTIAAREHPHAASTLVLAVGAFAFIAGYAFGSASRQKTGHGRWY